MKINLSRFEELHQEKLISKQKHPEADLLIWNYTPKVQFGKLWSEETMMARGLITDLEGNVVARPFKKFFNLGEYQGDLPIEKFKVTEKLDGSLGILYHYGGKIHLATRGSFISEQAIKGTEILQEKYKNVKLFSGYTYLFEIIYPSNRIVVDYGNTEDLILLSVIDTHTGKEYPVTTDVYGGFGLNVVKTRKGIKDIGKLQELQEDNKEGFVITFASGLKLKVKFDEYVRLHRLVTGVNAKSIWELLRYNQEFKELMERVPDEFYQWVKNTKEKLEKKFAEIESDSKHEMAVIKGIESRKDKALWLKDFQYRSVVFAMLDKKDYKDIIWKMIRPVAEKPFKEEI